MPRTRPWLIVDEPRSRAAGTASGAILRAMNETLGATLSGIALADTDGHEIRLGSLWQERPAVLVFLRHYG